jgi:hypothetical protein
MTIKESRAKELTEKPYIVLHGDGKNSEDTEKIRYRRQKDNYETYKEAIELLYPGDIIRGVDPVLLVAYQLSERHISKATESQMPYVVITEFRPSYCSLQFYQIVKCSKKDLSLTVRSALRQYRGPFPHRQVRPNQIFAGLELEWKEPVQRLREERENKYLDDKVNEILKGDFTQIAKSTHQKKS